MHHFYGPGSMYMVNGNFWWMGPAWMVLHLLFWVFVIYVAVKLFNKYFQRVHDTKAKEDNAMAILRERYAKGEIDSEEFKQRKTELE